MDFEKVTLIGNGADDVLDVVSPHGVVRNNGVKTWIGPLGIVTGGQDGRIFHIVVWEEAQKPFDVFDGICIAFTGKVSYTALAGMGHSSAEIFLGDHFAQH